MKINRLETHDRLLHLKKDQGANLSQGFDDCLKKNPLSLQLQAVSPYIYIFAHPRTDDDGVTKRMLFQPRLSKPNAQTNSYLVRAKSGTDILEICWFIPPREMWSQYQLGNITENETVLWSINQFTTNRERLEAPNPDDLSDEKIRQIYMTIRGEKKADAIFKDVLVNETL